MISEKEMSNEPRDFGLDPEESEEQKVLKAFRRASLYMTDEN